MSIFLLALLQASSPFEITDEQFQPYSSCVHASARLLVKDTPRDQLFKRATGNCFWEYQSMTVDLAGKALEQPGADYSSKPDHSFLRKREEELHREIDRCAAESNASNSVMGC